MSYLVKGLGHHTFMGRAPILELCPTEESVLSAIQQCTDFEVFDLAPSLIPISDWRTKSKEYFKEIEMAEERRTYERLKTKFNEV